MFYLQIYCNLFQLIFKMAVVLEKKAAIVYPIVNVVWLSYIYRLLVIK